MEIQPIQPVYRTQWQKRYLDEKVEFLKLNYCSCVKFHQVELAETMLDRIIIRENELLAKDVLLDITV